MSMSHIRDKSAAFALVVLMGALAFPAQGASFDCAKAGTKVEHLICDNPELSKLDDELGALYTAALGNQGDRGSLRRAQKSWLKGLDKCLSKSCVTRAYQMRISQLKKLPADTERAEQDENAYRYQLISGAGKPICEELVTRMNKALRAHPNGPVCALDILKRIPGVELPRWKQLDIRENKAIYERFVLANVVREKYYHEIFSESLPKLGSSIEDLTIPLNHLAFGAQVPGRIPGSGEPITGEEIVRSWAEAVNRKYKFYRMEVDGGAAVDSGVLLMEISQYAGADEPTSCSRPQIVLFSSDLSTAKPLPKEYRGWVIGPTKFPFKYGNEYLGLHEIISEAHQLSNGATVAARRDDHYCWIQGNLVFPPQ